MRFPATSKIIIRKTGHWVVAAVTAGLLFAAAPTVGQTPRARPAPSSLPGKSAVPAMAAVPFASGEHLNFRVLWSKYSVNAGTVECDVVEQRDFFGHAAWHFRAFAHS